MLTKRTLILSFVFILTLVTLFAPSAASDGQALQPHRRMLKKRATSPATSPPETPQKDTESPADGPAIGVAEDPHAASNTTTTTGTGTGTGTSTTSSSSTTTTSSTTTSTTSTSSSTTSSTSTNSTSSTSTSSSSSTSAPPATPTPADNTPTGIVTPPPDAIVTNTAGPVTVTYTSSNDDSTATSLPKPSTSGSLSKASLSVIIVIASCIGGAIIIWTIIRKWKFGKSSDFDSRMNPIDWQPSASDNFEDSLSSHRRRGSGSSHGSFHSGTEHSGAGYGATSNRGNGSEFAHDFTAGPSHLAPVGGYADLSRGPSPQPMREAPSRGPSLTRGYNMGGQYGSYDTHGPRY